MEVGFGEVFVSFPACNTVGVGQLVSQDCSKAFSYCISNVVYSTYFNNELINLQGKETLMTSFHKTSPSASKRLMRICPIERVIYQQKITFSSTEKNLKGEKNLTEVRTSTKKGPHPKVPDFEMIKPNCSQLS